MKYERESGSERGAKFREGRGSRGVAKGGRSESGSCMSGYGRGSRHPGRRGYRKPKPTRGVLFKGETKEIGGHVFQIHI